MIEVTLLLPDAAVKSMNDIAILRDKNVAQVVSDALDYYNFITVETVNGSEVLVKRPDGEVLLVEEHNKNSEP